MSINLLKMSKDGVIETQILILWLGTRNFMFLSIHCPNMQSGLKQLIFSFIPSATKGLGTSYLIGASLSQF